MLYKNLIRPILFLFDPEFIHRLTFLLFRSFPFSGRLIRAFTRFSLPREQGPELFGLRFRHRIGIAGGLDKNAVAMKFMRNLGFSFMEIGTVTPLAQSGNSKPRLFRLKRDQALINRMGFNNDGLQQIRKRLSNRPSGILIGGNIGKNTSTTNEDAWKDYLTCFTGLYDHVDFFIVNVSCPNIQDLSKLQNKEHLGGILNRLVDFRKSMLVSRPILLKISPDLSFNQLDEVIEVVLATGIEGVVATNTSVKRDHLTYTISEIAGFGPGGLSGKPLSGISTSMIAYLRLKMGPDFPIIASGGIMTPQDAVEKLKAGADLVQVYTGFIYEGPALLSGMLREIQATNPPV
jgi:dihydroorotate dehydrogenase